MRMMTWKTMMGKGIPIPKETTSKHEWGMASKLMEACVENVGVTAPNSDVRNVRGVCV